MNKQIKPELVRKIGYLFEMDKSEAARYFDEHYFGVYDSKSSFIKSIIFNLQMGQLVDTVDFSYIESKVFDEKKLFLSFVDWNEKGIYYHVFRNMKSEKSIN
jgi:hypothetical protein